MATACDPTSEPWIGAWLAAWALVADELMHLERGVAPDMVLFDDRCVWTTAASAAPGSSILRGPELFAEVLPWRARAHDGILSLPDGQTVPIAPVAFTSTTGGKPFFVMAAPEVWRRAGVSSDIVAHETFVTGIFVHEFSHARHINSFNAVLDAIEETWSFPEAFTSDVIEARFATDKAYVGAYERERDALVAAIDAPSPAAARAFAATALRARSARQTQFFRGKDAVFQTIDEVLVTTEGAAQWAAFAWLTHPKGAALTSEVARAGWGARGGHVRIGGLALFMAVDRLVPDWQRRVFTEPMTYANDLLALAAG